MRPVFRTAHPRGIRNFNPGNIRRVANVRWQGMASDQRDGEFVQFSGPRWGIRAIARVLITYQDKRQAGDGSRIDTVREIIERWAPAIENDTQSYTASVSHALGLHPDQESVDVYDFDVMRALVIAIIRHENGPGPLPGRQWYGDTIITEGLALAGLERGVKQGSTV